MVLTMKSVAIFFLAYITSVFIRTDCLADGFSEPVDIGGIKFSQYEVADPNIYHQEPISSPDGKYLAYIRVDVKNNTRKLWIMDRNTGEGRPVTDKKAFRGATEAYPNWSPDGKFIAYTSLADGKTSINVVVLESAKIREISDRHLGEIFSIRATWSPDSQKLAVNAKVLGMEQMLIYDIRGGSPNILIEKRRIRHPTWSPVGGRIYFVGEKHEQGDLWSVDVETLEYDAFNTGGYEVSYASWSSEGEWLAFQNFNEVTNSVQIYVVPSSGGFPTAVTTNESFSFAITVAWDYASDQLLFTGQPVNLNVNHAVALVDTAGGDKRILKEFTDQSIFTWWRNHPSWSPDEKMIGFTYQRADTTMVMLISTETGEVIKEIVGSGIDFSPDGSEFVFERDNRLWTTGTKSGDTYPITLRSEPSIRSLFWSPDGESVLYRSEDGCNVVSSYGGETEKLVEYKGGGCVGWTSDSERVLYHESSKLRSFDINSGEVDSLDWTFPSNFWGLNISSDAELAVYTRANSNNLYLRRKNEKTTKEIVFFDYLQQAPLRPVLSPSGDRIALFLTPAWKTKSVVADISSILSSSAKLP